MQIKTLYEQQTPHLPIWAYGIQLCGTASTSNTEILEHFQSKALRMILDTPWYVPTTVIKKDLQIPTINQPLQLPLQQAPQRAPNSNNFGFVKQILWGWGMSELFADRAR
jgi:hypothetical protein